MNKKDQVRQILLMPISYDKKFDRILRVNNKINSSQKYYAVADADMSDLATGFYNIVYKDILNYNPILKDNSFYLIRNLLEIQ
ncbi:MAG: hypothetical protein ACRC68_15885 [Clostridium sp.]